LWLLKTRKAISTNWVLLVRVLRFSFWRFCLMSEADWLTKWWFRRAALQQTQDQL
jgi:hypothetical protein